MSQFFENGKWLRDIDRRRAQSGTSALVADFQGISVMAGLVPPIHVVRLARGSMGRQQHVTRWRGWST